ncbi:MAG: hypothetical protein ABUL72_02920, partial [Armatimonadota bacterium]
MNHENLATLASPPAWSVDLGQFGRASVGIAVAAFLLAVVLVFFRKPKVATVALVAGMAGLV